MMLLLAGHSLNEICRQAPISRSALWRLRGRDDFQDRMRAARKQALEEAVNALHDSALVFVRTLRGVCEDSTARGSEKATAARSGLDSLVNATRLFDVEERLQNVERAIEEDRKS